VSVWRRLRDAAVHVWRQGDRRSEANEFLQGVQRAVAAGRAFRLSLEAPPPEPHCRATGPALVETFLREAEQAGCVARAVETAEEMLRLLEPYVSGQIVLAADVPLVRQLVSLWALLHPAELIWCDQEFRQLDTAIQRRKLLQATVGIAAPPAAVAETGSLVYVGQPDQPRSVSLLPSVHVALVKPDCVLADLFDLPAFLRQQGLAEGPHGVFLVTGPSKTGDIELRLARGVHGPGTVLVLVLGPELLQGGGDATDELSA
jgi:L-lactate utilization protein LutC